MTDKVYKLGDNTFIATSRLNMLPEWSSAARLSTLRCTGALISCVMKFRFVLCLHGQQSLAEILQRHTLRPRSHRTRRCSRSISRCGMQTKQCSDSTRNYLPIMTSWVIYLQHLSLISFILHWRLELKKSVKCCFVSFVAERSCRISTFEPIMTISYTMYILH